jgi:hypothetical protein
MLRDKEISEGESLILANQEYLEQLKQKKEEVKR